MKRMALFTLTRAVLLMIAIAAGIPRAANAQEPMIQLRLEGTVESVDGNTVVFDGLPLFLNEGMDISALVVGEEAAVTGILLADNAVLVVQAEALEDGGNDEGDDRPADDGVVICHVPTGNPDNAHSLIIDPAAAEMHIANHGDTMGPCEGDQTACDTFTPSPIADSLVLEFGESDHAVDAWICQGFSYTHIVYALLLAEAFDDNADALLQRVDLGESWQAIWTEYGVTPAELITEQGVIGDVEPGDDDGEDGDGDDDDTGFAGVAICHRPSGNPDIAHTIMVGQAAAEVHLAHGDTTGPCP
ncbi:MAG: hypothetical protein IPK19_39370 [Chloroflexi bacterium]|nr:hypothetical protein [Chloroflexota bacterium]